MLLLALALGLLTGLLPGLHPNSAGAVLLSALGPAAGLPVVLMVLLGLHVTLEFLSSIFLGVPESDTEVGVLPGRRLFLQGRAQEAAVVCALSAVLATAGALALSPIMLVVLPPLAQAVHPLTGWILAGAVGALLLSEMKEEDGTAIGAARGLRKIGCAAIVFVLAGVLGLLALNLPMGDPLLALFVGFFTMPMLLGAGNAQNRKETHKADDGQGGAKPRSNGTSLPQEEVKQKDVGHLALDFLPYVLLGLVMGGLADLLPGISTPAQIAVFASLLVPLDDARRFLALVSSIAASHAAFAVTAAASIGVSRVGAVALAASVAPIRPQDLPVLLGAFALAVGIGAWLMVWLGSRLARHWKELDLDLLRKMLAIYLVAIVGLLDGWMGLAVLATATAIGLLPLIWGVRRTHVMGAIIGPSLARAFGAL